jgi:hypothetical protein
LFAGRPLCRGAVDFIAPRSSHGRPFRQGGGDEVHAHRPRAGRQDPATDGPFVETKEALGGYLLFDADDLDAAIELASPIPAARMGGAIGVRPVVER